VTVVEVTSPPRLYEEGSLLRRARAELRAVVNYRELLAYLVRTNLRARSAGRFFGFVWWILDPLLLMATYVLLVKIIFHRGGATYPVFVFCSLLGFRFFSTSVTISMSRTVSAQSLARRVLFPRSVVPLASVCTQALHYTFGLGVLYGFAALFGVYPAWINVLFIPIFAIEFLFSLGMAFLFSALNIFVRDLQNLTTYLFRLVFYLAPGLYPLEQVPAGLRHWFFLNPMTTFFIGYHNAFLFHEQPHWRGLLIVLGFSCCVLVFGYLVFIRLERSFNKVL
jgi:lipopolysaccharide transport system permease protein